MAIYIIFSKIFWVQIRIWIRNTKQISTVNWQYCNTLAAQFNYCSALDLWVRSTNAMFFLLWLSLLWTLCQHLPCGPVYISQHYMCM